MAGENTNLGFDQSGQSGSNGLFTGSKAGQRVDHHWHVVQSVLEGASATPEFVAYSDHFLGDTIHVEWAPDISNSGSIAINAQAGGAIRLTTDSANATDYAGEALSLSWLVSNGWTIFKARVKQNTAITNRIIEIGLADALAPSGGLMFSDPSVPTAVGTNAAVFGYKDGSMTTYSALAVNAGGTPQAVTAVATPSTSYQTFEIRIDALGNAAFYLGNLNKASTLVARISLAVATTSLFTPRVTIKNTTAAAHTMDVDMISIFGAGV